MHKIQERKINPKPGRIFTSIFQMNSNIKFNSVFCDASHKSIKMTFNQKRKPKEKKIKHPILLNRFQLIDGSNLMRFEFVVAVIELKSLTIINIR